MSRVSQLEGNIDALLFDVNNLQGSLRDDLSDAPIALKELNEFMSLLSKRLFIPQRYSGHKKLTCWDETLYPEEQDDLSTLVATERSLKIAYKELYRLEEKAKKERR